MKNAKMNKYMLNYKNALAMQDEKNSTGSAGKMLDVLVRDYLMKKGIENGADVKCRKSEKHDFTLIINKKVYNGETKSGGGAILYGDNATVENVQTYNFYKDVQLIAYTLSGKILTEQNFMKITILFTRQQFIDMLEYTGKNGINSSVTIKTTCKGVKQAQIQTWSAARESKFFDYIEANNIPTLEQFAQAIGRA